MYIVSQAAPNPPANGDARQDLGADMSIHPYNPQCGCNRCGNEDLQQARDDESREAYRDDLIACPDFIAELALSDEEAERAAAAVTDADMAELGRIVTTALYRAADELIATRADESGITPGEAAERMYEAYRPEPARGAA